MPVKGTVGAGIGAGDGVGTVADPLFVVVVVELLVCEIVVEEVLDVDDVVVVADGA